MMNDLKVKCKQCGRMARPDEFKLDYEYKMMVCPNCIKDRKLKSEVRKEADTMRQDNLAVQREEKEKAAKAAKPAGWDREDEYLEKAYGQKMRNTVIVKKADGDKVNYRCPNCSYEFLYDTARKHPGRCPYCSAEIFRLRVL